MKPYRKHLRNVHWAFEHPSIQKLLPSLDQLDIGGDPGTWKVLVSHFAFKTLTFNLNSRDDDQIKCQNLLIKNYKSASSRNLHKMKALTSLDIEATSGNLELALFLLEFVNKNVNLGSLKNLSLRLESDEKFDQPEAVAILDNAKASKPLEFLTKLEIEDAEIYLSFFSAGDFQRLSILDIKISPQEGSWDFSQLARFKGLPMAQKFTLHLQLVRMYVKHNS